MNIKPLFSLFLLLLVGCQHLDVAPDASLDIQIDSEEKIAELITGAYPTASYFPFLEARTDNVGERPHGTHYRLNEAMFFWEDYDQEDLDTPLSYWKDCYAGIAQVNKALELLRDYPKTPRVKALYGEAFALRAYLHFMLVNIWAEPYRGERSDAPGIPYVREVEKNALVNYDRSTVGEVYDRIEEDLRLAVTLISDDYYNQPRFHFTKKALYAFATRFYLHKGDWQAVVDYADYVLGSSPQQLLRSWRRYELGASVQPATFFQHYLSPDNRSNLLLATTESRYARDVVDQRYGGTLERVQTIFDKHGISGCEPLKTLTLLTQYYFSASPSPVQLGYYIAKHDEHRRSLDNTSLRPREVYTTNVLFTTDEVMLNRMEALAMLGDYERALDDLAVYLRAKYDILLSCDATSVLDTSDSDYAIFTPFYGLTLRQLAMVKIVLGLRQREFFQEGLRWFDIRRFYLGVTRRSTHPLYQPLTKEDPRKLLQIPTEAQRRGLQPNPR